jgi:L-asparaginase II
MAETHANEHYPDNPVVVRLYRAGVVESVHRGAWCLADPAGKVVAGAGDVEHPVFVRSSIKSIQALSLFESGAAERFRFSDAEVALAIASHSGEPCHTEVVRRTLERLGLGVRHLRCGAHPPFDAQTRDELRAKGEPPSALHNNCSGKHAGFLALSKHLGVGAEDYLQPESRGQVLVRRVLAELTGVPERALVPGIDGCSAPTYRLPLRALASAFARRMTGAAARHPELVAGSRKCLDTDLLKASGGRLFAKIGAEAVHAIGVVGGGLGLALKIDDGGARALHALVMGLIEALGLARPEELERLAAWRDTKLENFAGLEVGSIQAVIASRPHPGAPGASPARAGRGEKRA